MPATGRHYIRRLAALCSTPREAFSGTKVPIAIKKSRFYLGKTAIFYGLWDKTVVWINP